MKPYIEALNRGEVTSFSRNSYEVLFSVFMIALAYFYRHSPQVSYPRILYFFLLLLGANFVFNRLLRRRTAVSVWLIDLILLVNFWLITGVIYFSGKGDSYFWALYLLPVFAASLMARLKDAIGVAALCCLAIAVMTWPLGIDLARVLSLAVKAAVLLFSAAVVYTTAQSRKRAEAVLAFKREQVEQLERSVIEKENEIVKTASAGEMGTLVSGVLHDLGNTVSVILMSAQIAYDDEKPDRADVGRILKAARLAKGVLANAMGIVRGQEYVFEKGPLRDAVENAALLTEYSARKKSASVELSIPEDLPPLNMSAVHVQRVFINIILNALSFVPDGGKVTVSAAPSEGGVTVVAADNGPGFPEKMLKAAGVKAFDTTRKEKGGTGLGLYVCEQIVLRHGGKMKMDNVPGGGARITIFLPEEGPGEKAALKN